ncbi:MAG: hypothetical protein IJ198_01915 [Lachnospiraceae bacterium]|nr:hypothetical protein [Lachnospiraceae bacterium]
MMKLNIEETMAAQTYAAYMIASSYFGSYVCTSRQMERQTYILYRTLKDEAQSKMERRIISFMEKEILPCLSKQFLASRVEIRFFPDRKGILITDGFQELEIRQTLKVRIEKDMYTGIERKHYQVNIVFRHNKENTAA